MVLCHVSNPHFNYVFQAHNNHGKNWWFNYIPNSSFKGTYQVDSFANDNIFKIYKYYFRSYYLHGEIWESALLESIFHEKIWVYDLMKQL